MPDINPLTERDHKGGMRVYVQDLDVFGTIDQSLLFVLCEEPMLGFHYIIGGKQRPIYRAEDIQRG